MRITFRRRFCLPGLGIIILKECFGSNFKAFSVAGKSDLTAALKASVCTSRTGTGTSEQERRTKIFWAAAESRESFHKLHFWREIITSLLTLFRKKTGTFLPSRNPPEPVPLSAALLLVSWQFFVEFLPKPNIECGGWAGLGWAGQGCKSWWESKEEIALGRFTATPRRGFSSVK